jgi:hypothetical protein
MLHAILMDPLPLFLLLPASGVGVVWHAWLQLLKGEQTSRPGQGPEEDMGGEDNGSGRLVSRRMLSISTGDFCVPFVVEGLVLQLVL